MGSGITFGGFNNIDFGMVLNAIMVQERVPLAALETQKATLQAQNTLFATFATKLSTLESAATRLAETKGLTAVSATSSDASSVGISAGSSSVTGRYEVVVSELARAQVTTSQTSYGSANDVVATAGVIAMARFGDPPIDIPLTGPMTLQDVADAVNSTANAPATATVVQVAPGEYRLVLTGRASGADNAFTVGFSTALSGGAGLQFTDTDGDGVAGDTAADNVQNSSNAAFTINGLAVSSATNTITDAVPGVTLTLLKKDATKTITVDVTEDRSETIGQIEQFAAAYNDILQFFTAQTNAAGPGKAGIGRDPLVRGLRDALRSSMMNAYDGDFARLAEVGIGFDKAGKVVIDKATLNNALDNSATGVKALFGGINGTGGAFGELVRRISSYTESGGLVADLRDRIDDQVTRLDKRLASMEDQLAIRRAALQREFIAADRAMSQLSAQGGSLTQLNGNYKLF